MIDSEEPRDLHRFPRAESQAMSQTPFSNQPDAHDPAAESVPGSAAASPNPEPDNDVEVDPITARNRANARFSTGPRTEEGKARASQNARTHGCSVAGLLPGELPEMLLIEQDLSDELRPNGPTEQECVRMAAIAMVRSRRCDRQLAALHGRLAESTREAQRRPKALRVERLEGAFELWSDALDRPVEFGEGLGPMYPALLANLKHEAQADGDTGRAELFQGLHACALAIPRMMELHRRFGHLAELPDGDGDAAEYSRRKGA